MSGFMNGVRNARDGLADAAHGLVDPGYEAQKAKVKQIAQGGQYGAVLGVIVAVAFVTIGIVLCATGNLPAGIALILLGAGLGYASYNAIKICENLERMANNPHTYMQLSVNGYDFHAGTVAADLFKNTFGLGILKKPILDFVMESFQSRSASVRPRADSDEGPQGARGSKAPSVKPSSQARAAELRAKYGMSPKGKAK